MRYVSVTGEMRTHRRPLLVTAKLHYRELEMTGSFGGGPSFDFDVIAKPIQTVHQFAFGKIGELTTQ